MPATTHAVVWAARAAWLAVAITGGAAIGKALDEHSRSVQLVGTVGAWVGWAVGALALAIAGVVTLTVARLVIPASLIVAVAVLIDRPDATTGITLLAPALAASALVATAEFGRCYLQASAYGAESRYGLRPPIGYLLACAGTWLVTMSALVLAPPALAGRAWALGIASLVVAVVGLATLPRRWHQLSRRWFVLVPAGLVVHDPVVLLDTLMLARRTITAIGLNDRRGNSPTVVDLTGPTPGLGVEIQLSAPVAAVLAPTAAGRVGTTLEVSAIVVCPTRPGSVVKAATDAGYPTPAAP